MGEYRRLCRWEDNIKMDLKEIGVDLINYMRLAQNKEVWKILTNGKLVLRVS